VCLVTAAGNQVDVRVAGAAPLPSGAKPVAVPAATRTVPTADAIYLPPGGGALVRDQPAPGADLGTTYLITDQGIRYPLGGPDAVRALGFGASRTVPLASAVLALFPLGPSLDTKQAQQVVAP
jgi:hypothetical protein